MYLEQIKQYQRTPSEGATYFALLTNTHPNSSLESRVNPLAGASC